MSQDLLVVVKCKKMVKNQKDEGLSKWQKHTLERTHNGQSWKNLSNKINNVILDPNTKCSGSFCSLFSPSQCFHLDNLQTSWSFPVMSSLLSHRHLIFNSSLPFFWCFYLDIWFWQVFEFSLFFFLSSHFFSFVSSLVLSLPNEFISNSKFLTNSMYFLDIFNSFHLFLLYEELKTFWHIVHIDFFASWAVFAFFTNYNFIAYWVYIVKVKMKFACDVFSTLTVVEICISFWRKSLWDYCFSPLWDTIKNEIVLSTLK